MKTFKVKTDTGVVEAQLLASFVGYVKGQGFRLVVTRMPGAFGARLTHRASTKAIAHVPNSLTHLTDWEKAGREALEALIAKHGEERVRAVLAEAES